MYAIRSYYEVDDLGGRVLVFQDHFELARAQQLSVLAGEAHGLAAVLVRNNFV